MVSGFSWQRQWKGGNTTEALLLSFYTFCTYVAWIVFRRQHFTEIEEEIGRLFRSDMFNIPRRKREDEESGGEKKRMTFVQFRRMMAKRPAMKKAINMRSPVMSTLLPSLREKAQNISEKKYRQVGMKFPARMQEHKENLDSVHMPMDWVALKGDRQSEEDHVQRHRDEKVCPVTEEGKSHGCARGKVCEGEGVRGEAEEERAAKVSQASTCPTRE
ncbi:hypothetical protein J1605_000354 [Eschrichtius robustus]|uniref:Protein phosphatase 1 regulatory subunit 36 n=1 Tax=Eschrichtius robustus TaxID=9764 RepID=A0AB34H7S8_ESCRO|nr:hypothetical protein J1605_000354 [Eschrichtius robustus]MBW04263.1 Protein phosphatase 1 regulatory subunit 36 [Eschrichtius robustus]